MPTGSLNHYVFKSIWHVDAPFDDVCAVLSDVTTYCAWWPEIRSVTPLDTHRVEMVARSLLPYELRFVSAERDGEHTRGVIDADLSGDLEGFARFTVEPARIGCQLTYDQEVDANKGLLKVLAPLARPAFKANHSLMMKHGEAGLRTFLAGYAKGSTARG